MLAVAAYAPAPVSAEQNSLQARLVLVVLRDSLVAAHHCTLADHHGVQRIAA